MGDHTEGTRLILIRHGESQAQADRIVGGHRCTGLSDLGRRQAEALARRFAETRELGEVAAVHTSLMERAAETAAIVAEALGHLEVHRDCDFCEHHPGESGDGLPWEEFDRQFPMTPGHDPDGRRTPDGESFNEMAERVARGLDGLADKHPGETVVVVCHGGGVGHSMLRWLGLPHLEDPSNSGRAWFVVENTAITEWRYGPAPFGEGYEGWQLVRFNDFAHLAAAHLLD